MTRLLLVRHGHTKLNNANRFWGKTDVELSEDGIQQAERLRYRLATQEIHHVYSSSLSRARLSAEIIARGHGLKVTACPELNELNFGLVEGLSYEEIGRLHPELGAELEAWSPSPHFPGGESFDKLNGRVGKFLPRLKKHKPEETVLIVAHAGPLRLIVCNLLGIDTRYWRRMHLDFGSLSIMETYPQGAILRRLNDVSHYDA
jgi:alpha-ribazole phosphatase